MNVNDPSSPQQRKATRLLYAISLWFVTHPSLFAADPKAAYFDETKTVTLFAFDDVSIPFTQNLKLLMNEPQRHPANPVLKRGEPGEPDSWAVQFYGSVIRVGDKFRMWYVAVGEERLERKVPRSSPWRVAYAESDDGVNWTKPNLGLVSYRGSRDNNLVLLEPRLGVVNLKVLYEPDDPNPEHRYKMGAHVWFPKNKVRLGTLATYASPDGLTWTMLTKAEPVNAELPQNDMLLPPLHFEPVGGLYKWDGLYYASGQNAIAASRPYHGRVTRKIVSHDFVNWSHSSAIGFVRTPQHTLLGPGKSRDGEQTHEGISVWNRGNVLLGVSGLWHGDPEWSGVTVDLGLVYSNNGIHFREPQHEHTFLKRGPDGAWDQGGLLQGQGFENNGEQTLIYYGAWDPRQWQNSPRRGGIGVVTLPRDRFGALAVDETTKGDGDYQMMHPTSSFITSGFELPSSGLHRFYLNTEGLNKEATLRVELLTHNLLPLPDYSGGNAAIVDTSGYQTPVVWKGKANVSGIPQRVRVRVTFEGSRKKTVRFCALYVKQVK